MKEVSMLELHDKAASALVAVKPVLKGKVRITRNGEDVSSLDRLLERDVFVRGGKGKLRMPHGIEVDELFNLIVTGKNNSPLMLAALRASSAARAASNGRGVFGPTFAVTAAEIASVLDGDYETACTWAARESAVKFIAQVGVELGSAHLYRSWYVLAEAARHGWNESPTTLLSRADELFRLFQG